MLAKITVNTQDILRHIKQTRQIPELIEKIVARSIIEYFAAEMSITVDTEELQKTADNFRFSNELVSSEDTWKWLEKYALSLDDFEELIYIELLTSKLARHLFADKIEAYFFENQLNYTGAIIYEIILDDEDLAMELFYAINAGETSFYDVAREYIQDTELRRKCGYRGQVNRRDLKPEISAIIFAAKSPQLLKPIITSKGVHLILLEEIIQPKLTQKLRDRISSEFFDEWLKQQIEAIEVCKNLD